MTPNKDKEIDNSSAVSLFWFYNPEASVSSMIDIIIVAPVFHISQKSASQKGGTKISSAHADL